MDKYPYEILSQWVKSRERESEEMGRALLVHQLGVFGLKTGAEERGNGEEHHSVYKRYFLGTHEVLGRHCTEDAFCMLFLSHFCFRKHKTRFSFTSFGAQNHNRRSVVLALCKLHFDVSSPVPDDFAC